MQRNTLYFSLEDVKLEKDKDVAEVDRLTAFSIVNSLVFQLAATDSLQQGEGTVEKIVDDLTKKGERLPPRP